jgi:hypothetical protein
MLSSYNFLHRKRLEFEDFGKSNPCSLAGIEKSRQNKSRKTTSAKEMIFASMRVKFWQKRCLSL